jgi:hypothetical protein
VAEKFSRYSESCPLHQALFIYELNRSLWDHLPDFSNGSQTLERRKGILHPKTSTRAEEDGSTMKDPYLAN